jgi:hypothetical protein
MKKQILFLTFFIAAILVGNDVLGQGGVGRDPNNYDSDTYIGSFTCINAATLVSCTPTAAGPLNPIVGREYTYEVTVNTPFSATTSGGIDWYVVDATSAPNIFETINSMVTANIDPGSNGGAYIMDNSANYHQAVATHSTQTTVDITWKSFDGTNNVVLLVAFVLADDGCTDNIEVYRIRPQFNFTLNIASLTKAGAVGEYGEGVGGTAVTDCVAPIESAVYDASSDLLTVDYGEDYVYFAVNAANFVDSWMPRFELNYDGYVDEEVEIDWAYPADAVATGGTWHSTSPATPGNVTAVTGITNEIFTSTDAVMAGGVAALGGTPAAAGNNVAVGTDGECIIVRVRIDHGDVLAGENDMDDGNKTLTLAVDGRMYDAAAVTAGTTNYVNDALADIDDDGSNCVADLAFDNDRVNSTLTPRPAIASDTYDDSATPVLQPFEDKTGTVNTALP